MVAERSTIHNNPGYGSAMKPLSTSLQTYNTFWISRSEQLHVAKQQTTALITITTAITIACFGTGQCFPLLTAALATPATQGSCKHKQQSKIPNPTCCYSFSRQRCSTSSSSSIEKRCQSVRHCQLSGACADALSQRCGNNSKRMLCRPGHDSLTNTQHKKVARAYECIITYDFLCKRFSKESFEGVEGSNPSFPHWDDFINITQEPRMPPSKTSMKYKVCALVLPEPYTQEQSLGFKWPDLLNQSV
ncbi:uncharacterized protein V6R79_011072 [Siganus canaliculatus]